MKKFLSIIFILTLVIGVISFNYCLATETIKIEGEEVESNNETENLEGTEVEEQENPDELSTDTTQEEEVPEILLAKVIEAEEVQEIDTDTNSDYAMYKLYGVKTLKIQKLKIEIIEKGDYEGKTFEMQDIIEIEGKTYSKYNVGQKIYVALYEQNEAQVYKFDNMRSSTIIYILIIIAILLILLTRIPGLKTIGLLLLNLIIALGGGYVLYLSVMPTLLTIAIIAVLMIIANTFILNKINKQTFIIIASVILSTVITMALLLGFINLLSLNGTVLYAFDFAGTETNMEYIDVLNLSMIIATIGIAIDIAIRTSNIVKEERDILSVFKLVGNKVMSSINMVFIVWLGMYLSLYMTTSAYVNSQEIKVQLLNYEYIVYELLRFAIILLNVIFIIPITTILSKELLFRKKAISEGNIDEEKEVQNTNIDEK